MQITFDPHNVQECATIARLLGTAAPAPTWAPDLTQPAPKGSGTRESPYDYSGVRTVEGPAPGQRAPAQPDTPRADGLTATEQPDVGDIAVATAPEHTAGETDCHGMVHDAAIHSTPASFNADGSYRAKRGHKEAYDAAVAAATAPAQAVPAAPVEPAAMPMPQPASAAPATPPAPIDYKTMADRFMAKMSDPDGLPAEYEAIYTALSIGYDDLETNQTSIARLSSYMDSVDEGNDHDQSVRHAMSA